jgi:hypothetical protein
LYNKNREKIMATKKERTYYVRAVDLESKMPDGYYITCYCDLNQFELDEDDVVIQVKIVEVAKGKLSMAFVPNAPKKGN